MLDGKGAAKSAAIIMALSIAGKGMGLIREILLASYFGASFQSDAYIIAFGIPLTLYTVMFSASISVFIPVYARYLKDGKAERREYFVSNMFNIMALLSSVTVILGAATAPMIVRVYTAGFSAEGYNATLRLALIMMPSVIFYTFSELSGSFLQSHNYFTPTALTSIPFNILITASIILFSGRSMEAVAFGSLLAISSQFLIQVPFVAKAGYKFKRVLNFKERGTINIFVLMLPLLLNSVFAELNALVGKIVASCLGEGSISALDYADRIYGTVMNVFINPLLIVLYPRLAFRADNRRELLYETEKAINFVALIAFPLTVALIMMRFEAVSLIFQRGKFGRMDTLVTAAALGGFSAGLAGTAVNGLMSKAFYSFKDTKTPMIIGIATVGINVVLNIIFSKLWGIGGMSIAASLSVLSGSTAMVIVFKKKLNCREEKNRNVYGTLIKLVLASIIMGSSMFAAKMFLRHLIPEGKAFPTDALLLVLGTAAGGSAYCIMLRILRVSEWVWFKELIFKKISRI